MTFNDSSSISVFPPIELPRQGKYTSKIGVCRVCGDQARFIHYGALVCSPCKIFFRRYASYTKYPLQCQFGRNCEITIESRKVCLACRFSKCLAVGMSRDLIRKEDFSKMYTSKRRMTSKLNLSVPQLPTLDLLSTDRSSLTTLNWTLLSNVVHAFDNFIPIIQTRKTIEYLSICSALSMLDMSEILSMFTTFYISTESFIASSADFQILTIGEKSSLYERNLHGVLHLCATLILRLSGMFDSSGNDQILISVYGHEIFQQTKRIALQLDYDLTINKLILFILVFSSNCYTVDQQENRQLDSLLYGTFRLFGSQNVYVEILWKYMTYRYNYYDASLRFARIIKHMLDLLIISENAQQNNTTHQNFVDETSILTKQLLIINENEFVPVWEKHEH